MSFIKKSQLLALFLGTVQKNAGVKTGISINKKGVTGFYKPRLHGCCYR